MPYPQPRSTAANPDGLTRRQRVQLERYHFSVHAHPSGRKNWRVMRHDLCEAAWVVSPQMDASEVFRLAGEHIGDHCG